ncbi:HD domain-containing protein [Acetobacterium paludosum]|uniref:HD domain-containing protein n=1 Tax=Acetobacterium paludosum TaxID=52693 RepID=A0A923HUU1_9FIRM|nr:HD domain-containing phosphohydrolase [Acetobacterium paludosum]MBC3887577.1 HD domain-containing protein [Acetobacterium paludosum]
MKGKVTMISFLELTLELSRASDMVSPELNNHHRLVAYITYNLGEELNLNEKQQNHLSVAAILHDIGGLSMQERLDVLKFDALNPHKHAKIGWMLLKDYKEFSKEAKIIKFHHVDWNNGNGLKKDGEDVPLESHLIHLADRIATLISKDDKPFNQAERIYGRIEEASGKRFNPEFVKAFERLKEKEYFWFDLESISCSSNYYKKLSFNDQLIDIDALIGIGKLFARVIDFRSNFTAVHSEGVAAVARQLAQFSDCDEMTCKKILAAGYVHDIGKLSVPTEILEKPGKLTEDEFSVVKGHSYQTYVLLDHVKGLEEINIYASMHHERLDGTGYPFKLKGEDLPLGSRIMAVADIFTALTENRPYRKGMQKEAVIEILEEMADDNKIDKKIVAILIDHYQEVTRTRIKKQTKARKRYKDFELALEEDDQMEIQRGKTHGIN